ncbi:MAG: hypothetical protein WCI77_10075 [Candidatus Omnitrophota bacterium]
MLDEYFQKKEQEWDSVCRRCGTCCGAFDDPCRHLKKDNTGKHYCEIYQYRFGVRQAQGGEKFDCVPIKEILHTSWKNDWLCAYKSCMKMPWVMSQK